MRAHLVVLAALLSGCVIGPRWSKEPLAREPRGAEVMLLVNGSGISGELLALRDDDVLICRDQRQIVAVPWARVQRGSLESGEDFRSAGPTVKQREQMRLRSRFPQGLTPPLLAALLAAYGQTAVEPLP